jgi:uncharacterized protein YbgA (DUF1722 family)
MTMHHSEKSLKQLKEEYQKLSEEISNPEILGHRLNSLIREMGYIKAEIRAKEGKNPK